jgi:beta-galactosidase
LKLNASGWGNTQFLSQGKWVSINIDADKIANELPASGGLLSYKFTLQNASKHEIWNRVGYEFVRSPFEWRVDGENGQKPRPKL